MSPFLPAVTGPDHSRAGDHRGPFDLAWSPVAACFPLGSTLPNEQVVAAGTRPIPLAPCGSLAWPGGAVGPVVPGSAVLGTNAKGQGPTPILALMLGRRWPEIAQCARWRSLAIYDAGGRAPSGALRHRAAKNGTARHTPTRRRNDRAWYRSSATCWRSVAIPRI
jgi:hypothetical protein